MSIPCTIRFKQQKLYCGLILYSHFQSLLCTPRSESKHQEHKINFQFRILACNDCTTKENEINIFSSKDNIVTTFVCLQHTFVALNSRLVKNYFETISVKRKN